MENDLEKHKENLQKLYLDIFENNKKLPDLDKEFIRIAYKLLSESSSGPKGKSDSKLANFYVKFCEELNWDIKLDSTNLSYILNREYENLQVMYSNNIKMNFSKYLRQYINEIFGKSEKTLAITTQLTDLKKLRKADIVVDQNAQIKNI